MTQLLLLAMYASIFDDEYVSPEKKSNYGTAAITINVLILAIVIGRKIRETLRIQRGEALHRWNTTLGTRSSNENPTTKEEPRSTTHYKVIHVKSFTDTTERISIEVKELKPL